jgi:hypothetical protein
MGINADTSAVKVGPLAAIQEKVNNGQILSDGHAKEIMKR